MFQQIKCFYETARYFRNDCAPGQRSRDTIMYNYSTSTTHFILSHMSQFLPAAISWPHNDHFLYAGWSAQDRKSRTASPVHQYHIPPLWSITVWSQWDQPPSWRHCHIFSFCLNCDSCLFATNYRSQACLQRNTCLATTCTYFLDR